VNARDKNGKTPLHMMGRYSNKETVEFLISGGADINAKDKNGKTPLYYALTEVDNTIVEILKKHGANK
jgi:ankyrin repeat protein